MLQDAGSERHIPNDRIDCGISALCGDLFQGSTELYQILHDYFNHRVDFGAACLGDILDQKTAIGTERGAQGVDYFEDAIQKRLDSTNKGLGKVVGRIASRESPEEDDILFTLHPIIFGLPAIQPGDHVAHEIINISSGPNQERLHIVVLL